MFCVKDNQPGLFTALDTLDWHQVPITHQVTDRGHGRVEARTWQADPTSPKPPDGPPAACTARSPSPG